VVVTGVVHNILVHLRRTFQGYFIESLSEEEENIL
jgi:hypothetical protein